MRKSGTGVAVILSPLLFVTANLVFSSPLHAQAPFYQGKSIRLIIAVRPDLSMMVGRACSPTTWESAVRLGQI